MPLYELSVTTSAQQAEGSATTATVTVEQQVITEGFIFIDPGANGEVLAQLRFGEAIILPHTNSETVSVPAQDDPAPVNARLPGVPTEVELRAWAPNADFAHEVIAQFEAVPPENVAQEVEIVNVEDTAQATTQPGRGSAEELTE